jgi:hypothetical protein
MHVRKVYSPQSTVHSLLSIDCSQLLSVKFIVLIFTFQNLLFTVQCFSQGVSINTTGTTADNSAMLDISSSSQGLLIPRMSTSQRNNIASPSISLLIFNTTTNCFEAYVSGSWYSVSCSPPCNLPSSPSAGTNISIQTQIVWDWNTVSGAKGYKWNTNEAESEAKDIGQNTSYIQTGVICNTTKTLYIWAYNYCGNSHVLTMIQTASECKCKQIQAYMGDSTLIGDINYGLQTKDSGYIVTGQSIGLEAGKRDFWVVKTDKDLNMSWSRTFGGTDFDEAESIAQTSDRGYIIAGTTASFGAGGPFDIYLLRIDESGNLLWSKTYGGTNVDECYSVKQTADGGYIIAGFTYSFGMGQNDFYLIKTNENGNLLWSKTFGGTGFESLYSLQLSADGGYILAGATNSFGSGGYDMYLCRADAYGNILWNKTFGGTNDEGGMSVYITSDGGYIILGSTNSFGAGNNDFYLVKTDVNGNLLWSKTFGGAKDEYPKSVQQTKDGGYIIGGITESFGGGDKDCILIKTDNNGNLIWSKTFGGKGFDEAVNVQQTEDGGYFIAGVSNSFLGNPNIYLIKTDSLGNGGGCNSTSPKIDYTSPMSLLTNPIPKISGSSTIVTNPETIVNNQISTGNTLCKKCN